MLTDTRVSSLLERAARDGAIRAGRGLSGLVGQEISVHVPNVRFGTRADACDALGGPEALVLGAYSAVSGDIEGHVMLLFSEERALECVDLMSGESHGSARTVDAYAASAITELGNIVGSAFVNALADTAALVLHPNPPMLVHDMAMALVESVYAEILARGSDVVMMDTVFKDRAGQAAGLLILAPDAAALERLEVLTA